MNSSHSRERIKSHSYKVDRDISEKEEIINQQIDKSKKDNITNDDMTPVYNYPYEFYDEEKFRKEEINIKNNEKENMIKEEKDNKETKIKNEKVELKSKENMFQYMQRKIQEDITKDIIQKIEYIPENMQKDIEKKNQQLNKNEGAPNLNETKNIKNEEMKIYKNDNKRNVKNSQKKEDKIKEFVLKNVDKKQIKNPPKPKEEYKVPKIKEIKLEKEVIPEKKVSNQLHKSKFSQKTENDYNLMMKQLKNKDYKNKEENVIKQ